MFDFKWSAVEKRIARRAYDAALKSALAGIMADFKARAAAAETVADMWSVEDFLRERRREIDRTFDYRYSKLPLVFGRLILDGRLDEGDLRGLSDDKLDEIRHFVSFARRS